MSYNTRRITEHEYNPLLGTPPLHFTSPEEREAQRTQRERNAAAASREQGQRDLAFMAALNREAAGPRPIPPPSLREPKMSFDAAALDETIYSKGVAFNRDRLASLGQERFKDLVAADYEARRLQRIILNDLTNWPEVLHCFLAAGQQVPFPPRSNSEILSGRGADREAAARLNNFSDLWKLQRGEVEIVTRLYVFHDLLESLLFGQSVLERLDSEGRMHSRLPRHKGKLFKQWLPALAGPHYVVKVAHERLFNVLAWLTGETTPMPPAKELAREWLGVRAPSPAQINLCEAVLQGFLFDHRGYDLWNFVGRLTRQLTEQQHLEDWRKQLQKRFTKIAAFQSDLRQHFYRQVGGSGGMYGTPPHLQFDEVKHRRYMDRELNKLMDHVSRCVAQATEGACVARFHDFVLAQGKPEPDVIPKVQEQLAAAFNGATFDVTVENVQ
jgi:hypothetical protein